MPDIEINCFGTRRASREGDKTLKGGVPLVETKERPDAVGTFALAVSVSRQTGICIGEDLFEGRGIISGSKNN